MISEEEYECMTIAECLGEYSKLMKMFKNRGATRTNNFVGDMGETVTIEHYNNADGLPNLRLVEIGAKNIDAISDTNERYSIKAMSGKGTGTGVFTGLNDPDSDMPQPQLFEYVVIVVFEKDMKLKAIYELNWEAFMSLKKWNTSKRAYYLNVSNVLKRKAKIIYEQ